MKKLTFVEKVKLIKTRMVIERIIGRCYDKNGKIYEDKRTYVRNLLLTHSALTRSIVTGLDEPEGPLDKYYENIHEMAERTLKVLKKKKNIAD